MFDFADEMIETRDSRREKFVIGQVNSSITAIRLLPKTCNI